MDKDIFEQYRQLKTALELAKQEPSAERIFHAVTAYDALYRNLNPNAQKRLEQLISDQLPAEWRLWRRCAESYHRWPNLF